MRVSNRVNRRSVSCRIAEDVLVRLDAKAIQLNVTRSTLIEDVLAKWVAAAGDAA